MGYIPQTNLSDAKHIYTSFSFSFFLSFFIFKVTQFSLVKNESVN